MTRVGVSECGQRMSFKMFGVVLNKPQINGETKLPPTSQIDAEFVNSHGLQPSWSMKSSASSQAYASAR